MIALRLLRAVTLAVVAGTLVIAPARVHASAPPEATDDPIADEAKELFEQGRSAYNSSDYERSVDLFRAAFEKAEKISAEDLRLHVMTTLWFNLARAQVKAFDIDEDKRRLRQGKDLIAKYLRAATLTEEERAEAEAVEAEIDERLARPTAGGGTPATGPSKPTGPSSSDARPDPTGAPVEPAGVDDEPPTHARKPGRTLLISGAVVAGVGAVAGGALIGAGGALGEKHRTAYDEATTQTERDDALAGFESAKTLGIAGIAVGSALVVTGAALIAVGVIKQRKASVSPMAGRGTYGVALSMSF